MSTRVERLEMLELMLEQEYRRHYRWYGPTWRREFETEQMAQWWAEIEFLEAG